MRRKAFTDADGNMVGADWKGVDPMHVNRGVKKKKK